MSTVERDGRWRPGRDRLAQRHPGPDGLPRPTRPRSVVVVGGGIAGLAAATGLVERGIDVTLLERQHQFGGRVRAWPVQHGADRVTMSRGFHAFFRQYYNLRALLRRADPGLEHLRSLEDYPLTLAGGHTDSFRRIPRTPPLSVAGFVLTSPSFRAVDLAKVDVGRSLGLLDVDFPQTFIDHDGISAAEFLDRLRFPAGARHLALEVFARSFFADPREFSAGELIAMFHTYFVGSAEGLLFDVPDDDYDTALWAPLARRLRRQGARLHPSTTVTGLDLTGDGVRVRHRTGGSEASASDDREVVADAVVLALDPSGLRDLVGRHTLGAPPAWAARIGRVRTAPPFAVWRLWLDRPVAADRPAFLGTSGYGPLDNVSVLDRFEAGAARWAARTGGSVLELHAYALPDGADSEADGVLRRRLRRALAQVYPETAEADVLAEELRVDADCVLVDTSSWADRPTVDTPDPRLVLAGDTVRCDVPVALMERAATTGFQAANVLLAGWGVRGHDLWTVPTSARQQWPGRLRRLLAHRRR